MKLKFISNKKYKTVYYFDNYASLIINGSGSKYFHITKILNNIGNRKAIVIGMNPGKQFKNSMDRTNDNIVKILRDSGYNSYIMINTFSLIESIVTAKTYYGKSSNFGFRNSINIKICKRIIQKHKNYDLIIACTNNKWIRFDFFKNIIRKNKGRIKLAIYNGKIVTHFSPTVTRYLKNTKLILKNIKNVEITSNKRRKITKQLNKCKIMWY